MNKNILYNQKTNFINSIKFKIPINSSIADLKIQNIHFFSKILPKGKIAIYGNYEILILYTLYNSINKFKNTSICRKVNFYKTLKTKDILQPLCHKNIKSSIDFITKPQCHFSICSYSNPNCYLGFSNICKVHLISPLSITLSRKNKSKKSTYSEEPDLDKNSMSKEGIKRKRFIEASTIIGRGSTDLFIEQDISIPDSSPLIWSIDNIKVKVEINKINLINDKVIVSGFANININYKTLLSSCNEATTGNLNYIQVKIPFTTPIDFKIEPMIKLKCSDNYQLIKSQCLGITYKLCDPSNISPCEVVYNKLATQLVIQIKLIATRNERIFI